MRKEDNLSLALAKFMQLQYPNIIYHFDTGSGSNLSIGMAMRNKRLNCWNGFPDLFICEQSKGYCGMFLELKKEGTKLYLKDGVTLVADKHIREQYEMLRSLRASGYWANFGIGLDDCINKINKYLKS